MSKQDYYDVLGVPRGTSDKEIKRAYRRLARKYHPDVNPNNKAAAGKFREITEAYEVLSNPAKRRQYDQFGHSVAPGPGPGSGTPSGSGFEGFDFSTFDLGDLGFGDFFSGLFRRGRPEAAPQAPTRGEDLHYSLDLSFEDAIRGLATEITLQKESICSSCSGSGVADGAQFQTCPECGGSGRRQTAQGVVRFTEACPRCRGAGRINPNPCSRCGGKGTVWGTDRIAVKIPPGVDNGSKVRLQGKGAPGRNGGPAGDLYIVTRVRPHPFFERKGDNLYCEVPVTITEAALGAKIEVPTIEGAASMIIPPGTSSGQVFRLREKGVPHLKGTGRGDQYVSVKIVISKTLDTRSQELLREFSRLNPADPRRDLW